MGLLKLFLFFCAFLILRRVVRGLFLGSSKRAAPGPNPPSAGNPSTDADPAGLQQEIEEAEYEDLD
jgi:hypothetical protein